MLHMEQMQHCISLHSAFHADLRDNFEKRVFELLLLMKLLFCELCKL